MLYRWHKLHPGRGIPPRGSFFFLPIKGFFGGSFSPVPMWRFHHHHFKCVYIEMRKLWSWDKTKQNVLNQDWNEITRRTNQSSPELHWSATQSIPRCFLFYALHLLESHRVSGSTNVLCVALFLFLMLTPLSDILRRHVSKMIHTQINVIDCLIDWACV